MHDVHTPPSCPAPPIVLPRAGGVSLGEHKIFCYGSLYCCVGDCVVRHCHLYPLYSWKNILLAFAEMEFDSTTMFTPGTNVMVIRSTGEPVLVQVVGYSEHGDACCRIYYECGVMDIFLRTSCILQGTFLEGSGFPKICLHLPSLLPKGPNHRPRVLPKAFQGKVVSMFRSSRSSGAGPRNLTPRRSRSRSLYIGSPLNASYAVFFRFSVQFLCLKMCVHSGSMGEGRHLATVPQGVVGVCLPWGGAGQGGGVFCLKEADWGMMAYVSYFARGFQNSTPCLPARTMHSVTREKHPCIDIWSFTVAWTKGGGRHSSPQRPSMPSRWTYPTTCENDSTRNALDSSAALPYKKCPWP